MRSAEKARYHGGGLEDLERIYGDDGGEICVGDAIAFTSKHRNRTESMGAHRCDPLRGAHPDSGGCPGAFENKQMAPQFQTRREL